ncbi:hypothetical protein PF005_g23603 [Phytophthora fragariae]|uniref:Uncharacterized protein n=2 Tax=Phytophthora TaxID=4783 RepID=A0A6A3DYZ8_9STRA|nr:hypothetical protein PF003_g28703 [Phytophthora fragariae]KAE8925436.1 hypothetical protein PF009_g24354 [Phytophthora fragariae]KAE8980637.1 hypothetical protein PF011_g22355 [Phytophthora fragariae]KAE9078982.1 hypothetical protein PF007_g23630 [Phytophthora fragariae]KAE9100753.1 hypothetical protein PF006_g22833 [Phytophthora fragariae]
MLRQVGSRVRLLRAPQAPPRLAAPLFITADALSAHTPLKIPAFVRFLHTEKVDAELPEPQSTVPPASATASPQTPGTEVNIEPKHMLFKRIMDPDTSYHTALQAFNDLRARGLKLKEEKYLSLLYKASREGRYERVWDGYNEFVEDEKRGEVLLAPRAATTWLKLTQARMQMHRFVLWAMLDTHRRKEMGSFYQSEVVGKDNSLGIHEADALNFMLRMECTAKATHEQEQGLRQRVETLLIFLNRRGLRTSYSSTHSLFRLIFHRPENFLESNIERQGVSECDVDTSKDSGYTAEAMGKLIVEYMERFPNALGMDPKKLSIGVSAAAAAGQHNAGKLLLEHAAKHHVPIDAGSFAHAVESGADVASRVKVADLYMHAKENELVYTTQDTESSITNYLLLHAVWDGNYKHMMELLHEMQLNNNKMSNRVVHELFKSISQYRAEIRRPAPESDPHDSGDRGANYTNKKLAECPTIMELLDRFPDVIPRTVHSFSQGILQSLYAGDLGVALDLMRAALWAKDVKLRPEIYSQLLYPLLAGGQRGGDKSSDASVFDRLEVERCFDKQHPSQRTYLNSLIVNICQTNDDLSTMLVCLDRWQGQGHPPMSRRVTKRVFEVIAKQIQQLRQQSDEVTPGTAFIVDGMQLSYLAFMLRYREIMTWDAWTIERAIVRARTSGLQADVVALLAEADSRNLVLNSAAYVVSLCVLDEVGDPSAVVACAERMKANGVWEKSVSKDPEVQEVLNRASAKLQEDALATDRDQ